MSRINSIILILLLGTLAIARAQLRLNMDRNYKFSQGSSINIPLRCEGYSGIVEYSASGLPSSLRLDTSSNTIVGSASMSSGNYPILVRAQDQSGNSGSIVIIITVDASTTTNIGGSGISISSSSSSSSSSGSLLGGSSVSSSISPITLNALNNARLGSESSTSTSRTVTTTSSTGSNTIGVPSGSSININVGTVGTVGTIGTSNTQNDNNRLNNLLNTIGVTGSPSGLNPVNPSGSIPSGSSSTTTVTSVTNTGQRIQPTQPTQPTTQVTRTITNNFVPSFTTNDLQRTVVFQRQLNANKAIANILQVIDRKNVDITQIQTTIPRLQNDLNNALRRQDEVNSKIQMARSNIAKIEEGIRRYSDAINTVRGDLNNLQITIQTSENDRINKQKEAQRLQDLITRLQNERNTLENNLKTITDQLNRNLDEQARINSEIETLRRTLQKTRSDLDNIIRNIDQARRDVEERNSEVQRLEDLLTNARKNARDAQNRLDDLERIRISGPQEIATLETQLRQKLNSLTPLNRRENEIRSIIDRQKPQIDSLTTQINQRRAELNKLLGEIAGTTNTIKITASTFQNTQGDLQNAIKQLEFLQNQLPSFQSELRVAIAAGETASRQVTNIRASINALLVQLDQCRRQIAQYNIELERARVLKEEVELAVDAFVRQTSDALPFAVIGSQSSSTTLSTVTNTNRVNGGSITVGGSGVGASTQFSLISSFNGGSLFPFSFFDSSVGSSASFTCSGNTGMGTIEGIIQRIYGNNIMVRGHNGNVYTVNIGSCSKLYSPSQNYKLNVGDQINMLGIIHGGSNFNLIEGICY